MSRILPTSLVNGLVVLAGIFALSSCYNFKTEFPVIMTMESAHIDGKVASTVGKIVFPENPNVVEVVAQWISTLNGMDVHVRLTITNASLTFSPNDPRDTFMLKGVKGLSVPTSDVTDIYEITESPFGFKRLVVITKSGKLNFHLDGEGISQAFRNFDESRTALTNALTQTCKQAAIHHIKT